MQAATQDVCECSGAEHADTVGRQRERGEACIVVAPRATRATRARPPERARERADTFVADLVER